MWRCTVYWYGGARTVTDRMCAVARYYDISSKADCGDIFIIHDQKSSYRTPLAESQKNNQLESSNCRNLAKILPGLNTDDLV